MQKEKVGRQASGRDIVGQSLPYTRNYKKIVYLHGKYFSGTKRWIFLYLTNIVDRYKMIKDAYISSREKRIPKTTEDCQYNYF